MRSLPFQCGAIRIASVTGKRRDIPVSGFSKVRLLWLFRNYSILDFPVLTPKQQQLIAKMWNSASGAESKEAVATNAGATKTALKAVDPAAEDSPGPAWDLASLDLIGTVEGYLPQLYAPTIPAQFHVGDPVNSPVVARPHRLRLLVPGSALTRAIWSTVAAMAVLLLAGVIALGPNTSSSAALESGILGSRAPGPALQRTPPPAVAPADATPLPPAPVVLAHADAKLSPSLFAEGAAAESAITKTAVADAPPSPPHSADGGLPSRPLPNAMALNTSLSEVTPPPTQPALSAGAPATLLATQSAQRPTHRPANREVVIRVTVDSQGRAQQVEILQGSSKKTSAALHAARRFAFEPCNTSSDCDHLLKFTDYGDASIVQKID